MATLMRTCDDVDGILWYCAYRTIRH